MSFPDAGVTVAGVDGCKAGWIAVVFVPGGEPVIRVFTTIVELVDALPVEATIAVDMPIGLPDATRHGGRGPETLVRKLLGERQSSVFSIPSRAALFAADEPFTTIERWHEAHREASRAARETSDPPRGVSIQAFGIFAKIRELDRLLRARPGLNRRLVESHPEVAFWRLNGERPLRLPKKTKGKVSPAGMDERKALLTMAGYQPAFLDQPPPRGAAADDFLDAAALAVTAARYARGEAHSFPASPARDSHGQPIAIWV